jgi:small-conductance mechanosensitive channel
MRKFTSLLLFFFAVLGFSFAQTDGAVVPEKDSTERDSISAVKIDTAIATPAVDTADTVAVEMTEVDQSEAENKSETPKIFIENKIEGLKDASKKDDVIPELKDIISLNKIFWSIILLFITYFVIKLLVLIINRFAEKSTTYRITLKSISPFIRIFGWAFVLFVIIHGIFRPPMQTLIALVASVGIAVGFAAQDILKNIFGGVMILFDRPFQVGDKIEVGNYYGEVKEIGLRSTRIQTKDDSLVSVPNAEVVNTSVSNSNTGEANCQVVAEIYLPIDIDTNAARQVAVEAAQVSRYIYLNKPITVLFINEVKERRSYLKMRLKAYVSDIRYEFTFQSDMTEIVIHEFLNQGIINKEDLM